MRNTRDSFWETASQTTVTRVSVRKVGGLRRLTHAALATRLPAVIIAR